MSARRPQRPRHIRNLMIRMIIFDLMIDIHPFRWARWAFVTGIVWQKRSTQLFAGPFHIWTFEHESRLVLGLEAGLGGGVHGTFTPSGEDAIAFFTWYLRDRLRALAGM